MQTKSSEHFDVLIIGMGPAALSAAIYTGRASLKTAIFGIKKNSHLYKAHTISNYFGFEQDITGPFIMDQGVNQAKRFGAHIIEKEITSITIQGDQSFLLKDSDAISYTGSHLIICTGTSYALSGIKNEEPLIGNGISYCVTCDGFFFRNKKVAVVGNGSYAAEEAISLTSYTKDITILSHGKDFEFSEILADELKAHAIQLKKTPKIVSFEGADRLSGIFYADGSLDRDFVGVFMAIGTAGAISFAKSLGLELNGNYIKVNEKGETNVANIYAAGNCTGADPQAAVSVGQGCSAAMTIIRKSRGVKVYVQYN